MLIEGIQLSTQKRAQTVAALVEGNSPRATARMANASRNTVTKLLIDLAPVLLEMIVWGARYEETDAPAAVIREMEARRDDFLSKVKGQWEAEGSEDSVPLPQPPSFIAS